MDAPSLPWVTAVPARLRATNASLVDAAVAVAVAVPLAVPFFTDPPQQVTVTGAVLNAGTVVPLLWRRRRPFAVAAVVFVFAALVSVYDRPGQMLQYAGLVAVYTIADLGRRWQRRSVLAVILVTFPPAALLITHNTVSELMFTLLLPLAAYLLGSLARTERARQAALADRAVAEERNRIARDMHDVLAHAVSVMVVQAEAGPVALATDPDRAAHSFDVIAEAGRAAMIQLSDTLGILNGGRESGSAAPRAPVPEPVVAAIPSLVASTRRAGLRVELRIDGSPRPLAADVEVAGYRVVQEALTNALRHARAGSVDVHLEWADQLRITVTDDGPGPGMGDRVDIGGHGLAGIRRRAEACGGSAGAGATPGGFRVWARLPAATVRPDSRRVATDA